MHILFVSEYYPPTIFGGGEVNLASLAESIAEKEYKVSVLTSKQQGLKKFEVCNGVNIHRTLVTGDPHSFKGNYLRATRFEKSVLNEIVKVREIDLIHFIGTSVLAAPKLKKLGVPMFATVESYPALCPKGDRIYFGKRECKVKCSLGTFVNCQAKCSEIGKMKNTFWLKYNPLFLYYLFFRQQKMLQSLKSVNIIAISQYIQSVLRQHGLSSTVIPNSIDIDAFKRKNLNDKNLNINKKKKFKILYLGALIESKGPHILLGAVRGLDVRVDLYGKGRMKEILQKKIDDFKLDAQIYNPVSYEKVPNLYHSADLVVFPSIWPEPFGRIAVEAMAAGVPVIGSAIGGIKETLSKEYLVRPGDTKSLHEKISQIMKKRTVKNKNKLVDQYRREIVANNFLNCYKSTKLMKHSLD